MILFRKYYNNKLRNSTILTSNDNSVHRDFRAQHIIEKKENPEREAKHYRKREKARAAKQAMAREVKRLSAQTHDALIAKGNPTPRENTIAYYARYLDDFMRDHPDIAVAAQMQYGFARPNYVGCTDGSSFTTMGNENVEAEMQQSVENFAKLLADLTQGSVKRYKFTPCILAIKRGSLNLQDHEVLYHASFIIEPGSKCTADKLVNYITEYVQLPMVSVGIAVFAATNDNSQVVVKLDSEQRLTATNLQRFIDHERNSGMNLALSNDIESWESRVGRQHHECQRY